MRNTLQAGCLIVLIPIAACARPAAPPRPVSLLGTSGAASTSRSDLASTVQAMHERVKDRRDARAAVTLADALLRLTRVEGNSGLAIEAERVLVAALTADPESYDARRMLAATYLSQHRFRDALREAQRCQQVRQDDAWIDGVIGDANLELGRYDEAFAALDRMAATKPNAASYARVAYARELGGDLDAAVRFMRMATEATSAQDPESQAWHHAQLGGLLLQIGRNNDARREFNHAAVLFPGHPFATDGLARVAAADGDLGGALALVRKQIASQPSAADYAFAGDLLTRLGRTAEADQHYRLAEAGWRTDTPEPARLARLLADRGATDEAVRVAAAAWAERKDIFTADALAWAYYRSGRVAEASTVMAEALRTGTRDRIIRAHAAEISGAAER